MHKLNLFVSAINLFGKENRLCFQTPENPQDSTTKAPPEAKNEQPQSAAERRAIAENLLMANAAMENTETRLLLAEV
ncbi:MAG: hypothetical protein WC651_05115, partial [Candidatus Gracilibacteria bacterium]